MTWTRVSDTHFSDRLDGLDTYPEPAVLYAMPPSREPDDAE
jgi:hypothetical protein